MVLLTHHWLCSAATNLQAENQQQWYQDPGPHRGWVETQESKRGKTRSRTALTLVERNVVYEGPTWLEKQKVEIREMMKLPSLGSVVVVECVGVHVLPSLYNTDCSP